MSRMEEQRAFLQSGLHRADRRALTAEEWANVSVLIQQPHLPLEMRAAIRLKTFLEMEDIVSHGERIPAWRTIIAFPDLYAEGEKERLQAGHYIHEQGRVCNISSDWAGVLKGGLLCRKTGNEAQDLCIDAVVAYADRYGDEALSRAIRTGAKTYPEALKMFRILHFCLWASNVYHNTVGRMTSICGRICRRIWKAERWMKVLRWNGRKNFSFLSTATAISTPACSRATTARA